MDWLKTILICFSNILPIVRDIIKEKNGQLNIKKEVQKESYKTLRRIWKCELSKRSKQILKEIEQQNEYIPDWHDPDTGQCLVTHRNSYNKNDEDVRILYKLGLIEETDKENLYLRYYEITPKGKEVLLIVGK